MITVVAVTIAVLIASGAAALVVSRNPRASVVIGAIGAMAASGLGATACVVALVSGDSAVTPTARLALPVGALTIGVDSLSAFFLLVVFVVCGLAALFGVGYLAHERPGRNLGPPCAFFNLLVASMVAVVVARDGVGFLVAWELMTIASFFLVTFDDVRAEVRRAGIIYLIASHVGVVFLFVLFALLAGPGGDFAFESIRPARLRDAGLATTCFVLAVIGFGAKAGFWPAHIWLPEAHPAAPSHVSAVMSGVMIKMGIYGLLRVLTFLGPPPASWGLALIVVGAVTGVLGVLLALAQHDLKRLLAYHSVENIGIITLGIGVGLLGQAGGNAPMAFLGYAGALLHVLNHGLFKGLLFQCAGSVLHGTRTREIDSLGGLARRMPVTGIAFLVGAVAICGLPPLNGFVSEWLVFLGAFSSTGASPASGDSAWAIAVVPTLALIGGLAVACFVKAYGVVFLGEPRSEAAANAREPGPSMRVAMLVGTAFCIALGLAPTVALALVAAPARILARIAATPAAAVGPLSSVTAVAAVFLGLVALLAVARYLLLRRRDVRTAPTWGCGYERPAPTMQYTAASFAAPLLEPFAALLRIRRHADGPRGYFPADAHFDAHASDVAADRAIVPAARHFADALHWLRHLQRGRIQVYVVYVFLTLVALLVWQLAVARGG